MEKPPIQEGIFFLPRKEKTGKNFPWTLCTFKRTLVNLEKHAAFRKRGTVRAGDLLRLLSTR